MATGDRIEWLKPNDFTPSNGLIPCPLVMVGRMAGLPLAKLATQEYSALIRIPNNGTPLSTGITLQLKTVDDPNNSDVGKTYRIGVQCKLIATTVDDLSSTGAASEVTTDIVGDATSGQVTLTSVPITTANADTPVAGSVLLLTVRRIGSHANDTHMGRVVLLGIDISDT